LPVSSKSAPPDAFGRAAREYDREGWIASLLSVSSIAVQPDEERAAFAARLRELVPPGELRRSVRTVVYWTRLAG
jgi:hypothetical protein